MRKPQNSWAFAAGITAIAFAIVAFVVISKTRQIAELKLAVKAAFSDGHANGWSSAAIFIIAHQDDENRVWVSPFGLDSTGKRGAFRPFRTFKAAKRASQEHDTITILPGEHRVGEPILLDNRNYEGVGCPTIIMTNAIVSGLGIIDDRFRGSTTQTISGFINQAR